VLDIVGHHRKHEGDELDAETRIRIAANERFAGAVGAVVFLG
jgi:hypothetical protein